MSSYVTASGPYTTLTLAFVAWKTLLFLVALSGPGRGYDTSTDILLSGRLDTNLEAYQLSEDSLGLRLVSQLSRRVTRWDAIYFVTLAERGYLFEQEWAFGWGYSSLVKLCARLLSANASLATHSVVAVLISNVSHLVSIYLLYKLCEEIKTEAEYGAKAVVVALLHVIAPAGIFLSAPYGESLFAALTFAGCLAYARSRQGTPLHSSNLYLILAGLSFGLSCTIRGNGIFSGLIFLWELLQSVLALRDGRLPSIAKTLRAATVMLAGLLVAAGAAYPQYFAWTEYCRHTSSKDRRPWCNTYLPSIYTFVQQHYWNVGFLRYWTLSNLPLFALAVPMLALIFVSASWGLRASKSQLHPLEPYKRMASASNNATIRTLAFPQLVLAVLALTNFHVQIITRISSAYPVLYIWLASRIIGREPFPPVWLPIKPQLMVYWMVVYALVQASLFAGFLPPA